MDDEFFEEHIVDRNPDKYGGETVFKGTRVPVYILHDYLENGYSHEDFLKHYDVNPRIVKTYIIIKVIRGELDECRIG